MYWKDLKDYPPPYDQTILFLRKKDGSIVQDFWYDCDISLLLESYSHWCEEPKWSNEDETES